MSHPLLKSELHPRNRFRAGYDFPALIKASPRLASFLSINRFGVESLDFADPEAVRALNEALLKSQYGLAWWDIPPGFLCPPIPGRSDYLHLLADLISDGAPPLGPLVRILDVGVGANCVYPLIGVGEYGWSFVGADISIPALRWAEKILKANPSFARCIELRLQSAPQECFHGIILPDEHFHATLCNPPFFSSSSEAAETTRLKVRKLTNAQKAATAQPIRNFGGKQAELWCPGGELEFVRRMIRQSKLFRKNCTWFTSLISKSAHLPELHVALRSAQASEVRVLEMSQGQKKSRILAWRFS